MYHNKIILAQFGKPDMILTIRYLSGILRHQGYDTTIISIVPSKKHGSGESWDYGEYYLSDSVIEEIIDLCKNALFISFTVFTFDAHLLKKIYKGFNNTTKIPLVVGGPHPTLDPYNSSFFSDYVCIGDGEKGIVQLADKLKHLSENNSVDIIRYKLQGCENIFSSSFLQSNPSTANSLHGIESPLDSESFPDYSLKSEYIIDSNRTVKITNENAHKYLSNYSTFFSRGCVYNCTFCAHEALAKKSGFSIRIKSKVLSHFINELRIIRTEYPWAQRVTFFDPNILSNKRDSLYKILEEYKKNVNLPLGVTGFTFNSTNEDILRAFLEARMRYVIFGIQSKADGIRKLLNRRESPSKILEVDNILHKLKKEYLFSVQYDIIVDIPWGNPGDSFETIYFVSKLKAWDYLDIFSLRFFPGTKLFQKAIDDGIIKLENMDDEYKKVYRGMKYTYENFLLILIRDGACGHFCLKFTTSNNIVKIGQLIFKRKGEMIFRCYTTSFEKLLNLIKKMKYVTILIKKEGLVKTLNMIYGKLVNKTIQLFIIFFIIVSSSY